MNNWLIGGLVVIALAVGGFFVFSSDKDAMMEKDTGEVMMKDTAKDATMMETADTAKDAGAMMKDKGPEVGAMMQKGSYEAYAPEKLSKATTGDVVLFFRAIWCPTCKVLDSDIRAHLNDIPANVTILDVDYDTQTALKQKYGVTYQHTLVQVDASGNQINKWSGGQTLASLLTNVR